MAKTKPVTLWYRYNSESREYEYHHLDFGHKDEDKPVPHRADHPDWVEARWRKEFAELDSKGNLVQPHPR